MMGYARYIGAALVRTVLAALAGATIYALSWMPPWAFGPELPLWIAAVGALTLPIAFAGVATARLALRSPPSARTPILVLAGLVGLGVSVPLFKPYMGALIPAIDWDRGALLPTAACLSGMAAALVRWPQPRDPAILTLSPTPPETPGTAPRTRV